MPIIKSAAKRMRQNSKRARINNRYRREMRLASKQVTADITAKDQKAATASLAKAQQAIDKATKKGILHRNTAARRKARLASMMNDAFPAKGTAKKAAPKKAPAAKKAAPKKAAPKKPAAKKAPATKKKPAAKKKAS